MASSNSREIHARDHLNALPSEILENIIYNTFDNPFDIQVVLSTARTTLSIARTCKRLFSIANPILYKWNIREGHCSGLFWAARKNRVDIFERFVERGASVNVIVSDRTPPMEAIIHRSVEIVRYLVTRPEVNWNRTSIHHGTTALRYAAMTRSAEITRLLLACNDVLVDEKAQRLEETALHYASRNNMALEAKLMLDRGADPDSRNHQGWSPLNFTASRGSSEIVRLLLNTGKVDVNVNPEDGQPSLAAAIIGDHSEIVDMLMSHPGIDISLALNCDFFQNESDARHLKTSF